MLGLVAGFGRLPFDLTRAARRRGRRVLAVGLRGLTDPALASEADRFVWLHLGELGELIRTFREAGVEETALAGKVPKTRLFEQPDTLRLDARAVALLAGLRDRRDDAILAALAAALEDEGIRVLSQSDFVPSLLAPEGCLGKVEPTPEQLAELAFAWPLAKQIGALDIGQTLAVRDRAVLAVEAAEGTDEAIRRAGRLGGGGICVVKVMRPGQDPRFDLPTVGPDTLAALIEAKGTLLAVEAGVTLVLEREETVRQADAHDICLLGVARGGPPGTQAS